MLPYSEKTGPSTYERPCWKGEMSLGSSTYGEPSPAMLTSGDKKQPSGDFYEIDFTAAAKQNARISQRQVEPIYCGGVVPESSIYWRSPTSMLLTYLLGLGAAIGQHVFYSSLMEDYVGGIDQQQKVLRYVHG